MAYNQSPGRMNMPRTGRGIPTALTMPDPDPKDPKPSNVKYGDMKKSSTTDQSGRTTVTVTQPFSTPGSSKTGKSYKQFAAEGGDVEKAKKFNEGKSGSRTTTYSYGGTKSASVKPVSAKTPKPKIDLSKKPSIAKDYGSFTLGSNERNMNSGGHSTYGKTAAGETPKFSQSYTESPKNTISGKANVAKSRKITAREDQLMKSKFYNEKNNPYSIGENKFEQHLQNIENFEKRKNDKKFARQELIKSRKKAKK
jgi:hypothetical protein